MRTGKPRLTAVAGATLLAVAVPIAGVTTESGADWPQWRGPNRDGISTETGLLEQWPAGGPPLAWKAEGAGIGFSSFSTSDGRLFTLGSRGGTEFIIAFDASDGQRLWEREHGRRYSNNRGDGPRSTPTVDGDRVYALGANGDLTCLYTRTGEVIWSVNVLREFGGRNPGWGMSESPLVLEDRLLVNAGGRNASILALDKSDGSVIWKSGSDAAAYSSAVVASVGGSRQAVFFTDERVIGVDVESGALRWSYDRVANRTANIATPIVSGNRVFVSSDYGTGAALLELSPSGVREVYFTREMRNHHSSSVLVDDHLYGFSGSILTALRFADGQRVWRDRSVGKGSLIYADGRLYLFSENGVVGLAEASPSGYVEHGRFTLPERSASPTWSHPVVANGRLFLRDQDTIYAYDVRGS